MKRQSSDQKKRRTPTHTGRVPKPLSKREQQVLLLVAGGHTNREIAAQLRVSVKSVETYRARVMEKLDLRSRVELVRYALDRGILSSDQ